MMDIGLQQSRTRSRIGKQVADENVTVRFGKVRQTYVGRLQRNGKQNYLTISIYYIYKYRYVCNVCRVGKEEEEEQKRGREKPLYIQTNIANIAEER